ncbi:arylsulfatase, putative [Ixodes scapularis]|uniref:Arylsulfatase, putative n=1 Tax=Ixodes scapularis TaxID=6945 RepID=B7PCE1_IXOSC|nr:arylsulfatase, putative [Ixodes scapularis]|eukprot:XP_002409720.1 arylsulfatase, putative [Ixodes scapularis]
MCCSGVWKVHFHSSDESQCPYVCHCYGSYVLHHDPPLVFHLDTDPSERNPLSVSSDPRVHKVLAAVKDALRGHEASLDSLPQQFNFINTFWLPWLQPCCNFPRCSCREEDSTLL